MEAKEEVRARLNIEDVVGEYVDLKRAGRNFKGLSPFGSERTPSFIVSPEKQIWHDFSSNKGGDVFSFIMEVEGMDFRQALEHLARKAGVDLAQYDSPEKRNLGAKKKRLLEMHHWAAQYYQHMMVKTPAALEYIFKKRGLNKAVVQDFRIGYAPGDGHALARFLTQKKFTRKEMMEGGLLNRFDGDLFRERMMVPLMDASGQVIGFTGRIVADIENAPKYLNTPQTLLYDKSRHVFGLSQAKEAIRAANRAVIVEGNLDVVSSHQAGVNYVVATAGTAMTEQHLSALKRLTTDIRLAFDGDKAGVAATERAIGIASAVGVELTIITLPNGVKDPDELIQQDPALWEQAIEQAEPAVDWILEQYRRREDISTASGKRAFSTAGLRVIASLRDPVERDHYERKVAEMVGSTREAVLEKAEQYEKKQTQAKKVSKAEITVPVTAQDTYEDDVLSLAVGTVKARTLLEQCSEDFFTTKERQKLAEYLKNSSDELATTPKDLQDIDTYVKIVLLRADTRYAASSVDERYVETARLIRLRENEQRKEMQATLLHKLKVAEDTGDETAASALRIEINNLIKEIARGQRR